jgi:opacity protein-like surface antigen
MKKIIRSFTMAGLGVTGLLLTGLVQGQEGYFNAEIGAALADDVDLQRFLVPVSGKLEFDTGVRFGAAGGYNFNQYLGAELETGFIYNSIKRVDASLSHVPMMVNVVLRYDQPRSKWVPYVGAGAGGDLSILSLNYVTAPNNFVLDGTDTTVVFAWQAFAGVRYKLDQKMSIGAGYKYYAADRASWDVEGFGDQIKFGRANVHNFMVEFNLKF